MASRLFEYAVLYHPKVTRDAQGNETQPDAAIVIPPRHILAQDEKTAAIFVAREIPDQYLSKLDQIEILIRPFDCTQDDDTEDAPMSVYTSRKACTPRYPTHYVPDSGASAGWYGPVTISTGSTGPVTSFTASNLTL